MKLTRYLYFADEVYYSLIECFNEKRSINEVLFWAFELHFSGLTEELWDAIWFIYYTHCSTKRPKLEKVLLKNNERADVFELVLDSINLLYYSKKNEIKVSFENKMKRKRKAKVLFKWLDEYNDKYKDLIINIHRKKWKNIRGYLELIDDEIEAYEEVKKYFRLQHNLHLDDYDLNSHPYEDKKLIILSLVHYLFDSLNDTEKEFKKRRVTRKKLLKNNIVDKIVEIDEVNTIAYKVLSVTRTYTILINIAKYELERYKFDNYKKIYWYNWRYYAYRTPIWRHRFDKSNIKVDHEKKDIIFVNEDEEEEFCEKYDYEPDEQSLEVQNRSLIEIKRLSEIDILEKKVGKMKL